MAYYLEQLTVKFCTSYLAFHYAATLGATQGMQKMYDLVGATSPGFVCSTRVPAIPMDSHHFLYEGSTLFSVSIGI